MSQVESLRSYLDRLATAATDRWVAELRNVAVARGLEEFDAAAELGRMKLYIERYYEGVTPVSSFEDADGRIFDCVPYEQQPAARLARGTGAALLENAPPPAAMPGAANSLTTHPSTPVHPNPCSPGTVALQRLTLERMITFGTLENYFRKDHDFPVS
jgi:hypothetical protein